MWITSEQFRRLHHLTTTNMNIVSSSTRQIYTLSLFDMNYHFANLHFLDIKLQSNEEYYNSLNMLLDNEHLSHLLLLTIN
jgi:hypothetical protein